MKIGIIGSGNVGGTLGTRWARFGHSVVFSSRNPQSDEMRKLVADAGRSATAGTTAEAAQTTDVVLLATPWPATRSAIEAVAPQLAGKILIDATNPLLPDLSGLAIAGQTSGAEQVASWARGTRVVKAFNTIGYNIMANPDFAGARASLLYCGDDAEGKSVVHRLAADLGFDPVDAGPLRQARTLEPFALLWISMAIAGHNREMAFHLMKRR